MEKCLSESRLEQRRDGEKRPGEAFSQVDPGSGPDVKLPGPLPHSFTGSSGAREHPEGLHASS